MNLFNDIPTEVEEQYFYENLVGVELLGFYDKNNTFFGIYRRNGTQYTVLVIHYQKQYCLIQTLYYPEDAVRFLQGWPGFQTTM